MREIQANLIIHGIPESSPSTKRFEYFQLDQQSVFKEPSNDSLPIATTSRF